MNRISHMILGAALFALVSGGCATIANPSDAIPGASVAAVDAIRDSDSFSAQEKRQMLASLGLDSLLIDAILTDVREANQGGGDLSSALEKVRGGRYTDLTPDEIQIYSDASIGTDTTGTEVDASPTIELISDEDAAGISAFFAANNLNTAAELDDFLNDPTKVVPDGVSQDVLQSVFVTFDPDSINP